MNPRAPTDEVLDVVRRRVDLLDVLIEGPYQKSTLVSKLDVSRSTVDRATRRLESLGLVTYTDGGLRTTTVGRIVYEEYRRVVPRIESVIDARDLLESLPADADLAPDLLVGGTVVRADQVAPQVPGSKIAELFADADRCDGLARAHSPGSAVRVIEDRVLSGGMELSIVGERQFLEYLRSDLSDRFERLAEAEQVRLWAVSDVPYGLFLFERGDRRTACMLVYDGDTVLRGVVVNDSPDAVEWTRDAIRAYRQRAVRVDR